MHLKSRSLSIGSINGHSAALGFFLRVTLGRSAEIDRVPILKERRTLPMVLTPEEVGRIIAAAPGLKYQTAISVIYGAGLRASSSCCCWRYNCIT